MTGPARLTRIPEERGWHIEPTPYPEYDGEDAVQVMYGNHLLDTVKQVADSRGNRFWAYRGWTVYATREEAIQACKESWQPLIDGNLAAGREPLWQPEWVSGTGYDKAVRRPRR